ncbi:GNAT family N-acetyltransferase [Streptomyces sp. B-S-A8]|uniref:GNAT family N-acetyltransferase n=1 Tax=Streptomyces solicavernae TaxID=3043614 RepID=A0ABT6RMF3_9ACTN|nr:GNAT family N-acetyltransferase [Streptomyces sp. B-S-A8]MDI3385485.1 GNAT family N-acetyltransferase [Streptomyces sp. B-S-A8]
MRVETSRRTGGDRAAAEAGPELLTGTRLRALHAEFADLLLDTVHGGNSLGFLASLDRAEAEAFWRARADAVDRGGLLLLAVRDQGRVVGTVGVDLVDKANGRHRAEIVKLMVHSSARGRGLGRLLLTAAERAAAERGVTLLVLDTETGSDAEGFYAAAGWTRVGTIPGFAADPGGVLHPTTLFYKQLT